MTPSEGTPAVAAIAVFVGLPVLLLAVLAVRVRGRAATALFVVQAALVIAMTVRVLSVQLR